jgi:hypothetical protein
MRMAKKTPWEWAFAHLQDHRLIRAAGLRLSEMAANNSFKGMPLRGTP